MRQALSIIKNLLEQLFELGKRHLNIKVMVDDEPKMEGTTIRDLDTHDGTYNVYKLIVTQFISQAIKKLLNQKDVVQDKPLEDRN